MSVELTRRFEEYIEKIRSRRMKCREVVAEAKEILTRNLEEFRRMLPRAAGEVLNFIPMNSSEARCRICGRRAVERGLCTLHLQALQNILKSYREWRYAGFTQEEYVDKLLKLRNVGELVKEVVRNLREEVTQLLERGTP